jgi:monoamine oxidase
VPANRDDVERLCEYLAGRVEANGSKRPSITKRWRDSARLMLDNDGRTEQQVMTAIDWCQDHEFWRANILSMPKLRERYDQLRLQAQRVPAANGSKPSAADKRVADAQELKARMRRAK